MTSSSLRETDLYAPIKLMLEGQGYDVKGEIGAADIVATRGDEDPLIVELKTGFSLSLFHQGTARQALTDNVYIAVPRNRGTAFRKSLKANITLCRRLGLGLITVRLADGLVETHADPSPYKPRKSKRKKTELLKEFAKRFGDPTKGGATRQGLITAYRQDALRCLHILHVDGATKAAHVAQKSGVETARRIMADNHYGWFERVQTGVYGLTLIGQKAVADYGDAIAALRQQTESDEQH